MQRVDQDREERAEEGDEDDALLVGRPSMIAIGTQAIAGIGRSTSATGKMISWTSLKRPMIRPSGTADHRREREAEEDAPAAQEDVQQEFGSWIALVKLA